MYNVSIPKISDDELMARYNRIKPIVEIDGVKYFLREYTLEELRGFSYIWNKEEDKREPVNMELYEPICGLDFECIHSYGHPALFKPTIAEVLAQINKLDVGLVSVFEIIDSPKTSEDFYNNRIVFENGFHISKVRLYHKKS